MRKATLKAALLVWEEMSKGDSLGVALSVAGDVYGAKAADVAVLFGGAHLVREDEHGREYVWAGKRWAMTHQNEEEGGETQAGLDRFVAHAVAKASGVEPGPFKPRRK